MIGSKILYFDSINSTNDYLINLCKEFTIDDNIIVVTDNQTQGRGRMGKHWFSDEGLLFSFSLSENDKFNFFSINMLTGITIVNTLKTYGLQAVLKYPNDVIINNKKIAGVLIESMRVNNSKVTVVGVGINVNTQHFPGTITQATSMKIINKNIYDKTELLSLFINNFNNLESSFTIDNVSLTKQYLNYLYGNNHFVPCFIRGNRDMVKILSVSNKGILTIMYQDLSIETISYMDLQFLLI